VSWPGRHILKVGIPPQMPTSAFATIVAPVERGPRTGSAGHRLPLASPRLRLMLAPKIAAATGKTTHRFRTSVPHSAHGDVELPLGRSAYPRRVAEARSHRLRTHGVAVHPRPHEGTLAELAYVPRERVRPVGVHLDGDVIGRTRRSRCRRRPSLPFRPAPPSRDGQSGELSGGGRLQIGPARFHPRLLVDHRVLACERAITGSGGWT
jgi:hypothetical protein